MNARNIRKIILYAKFIICVPTNMANISIKFVITFFQVWYKSIVLTLQWQRLLLDIRCILYFN